MQDDHDELIKHGEQIKAMKEAIDDLQEDNKTLMGDRAKLMGYCAGVSGAVAIIIKIFWPK